MAPQAGANGVLPVSVLQKNAPASAPRGPKAPQQRLKLVLRRLPPGLTKTEFETALGDDWKLGAGRVDWMLFKKGKISKDLAKPSRPARAYLHVISQQFVTALGDHVRATSFNDAAKSFQDAALIGPPALEFAPYHRIPAGRRRNDNRQGTIDQDQEFKDFLESLTNPIAKPVAPEGEIQKEEKITVTPLIAALREKKANKEKPQQKGSSKHGRGESKDDAGDRGDKKPSGKSGKDAASGDKSKRLSKAEKNSKDAVKVLHKEAGSSKEAGGGEKGAAATMSPAPERKRGNASIAKSMLQRDLGLGPAPNRRRGTKRELTPATQEAGMPPQDTTGGKQEAKEVLSGSAANVTFDKTVTTSPRKESSRPSRSERRALKATLTDRTNNKTMGEKPDAQAKNTNAPAPVLLKKPQIAQAATPPRGPAASRAPPTEPAAARTTALQSQASAARVDSATLSRVGDHSSPQAPTTSPTPTVTGRQAFLKHANPSQGITEPLIEEALKAFGDIEKVEIDKRKGFAYVDFADPEGLVKAIGASPIKIAQGAVQVLERKEKVARKPHTHPHAPPHGPPTGPARGRGGFMGRGRGRGGARGGGHSVPIVGASSSNASPASPVPVAVQANDVAT